MSRLPKRLREHRTTVWDNGGGYVWRCTCGDYYQASGKTYRIASAGAKRHREYMRQLASGVTNARGDDQ